MGFVSRFRLRIFLRNLGNFATLFVGIAFASLLLLFGLAILPTMTHYADNLETSLVAEHQYTLKAPCNNTADSCELARHAESLGVDAIAAIPPIYFHLPLYAIADYWNALSAAAPNTDFIIYNIPQLAGVALSTQLLQEMAKNPRVIGVKNSSMPTQDIQMFKDAGIAARGEGGFVVFNGPDEQFVSGRVIGADGGIGGTYAVMPELFLKMNELIEKGDIPAAREIQYKADRIIYKMCEAHGNLYAVMKEILRRMYGLELGGVRAPLPGLIPEDEPIVAEAQKMIEDAVTAL